MKTIFIGMALCCAFTLGFATVWHVNQDATWNADFTQITTAVSDANVVDGDTLYVYGHITTYNTPTISKQLTIIGPGYFLGSNPGLQENSLSASMTDLYLNASGITIMGLVVHDNLYLSSSNCRVIGCSVQDVFVNSTNSLLQGCFIREKTGYNANAVNVNALNATITNCYFGGNNGFLALNIGTNGSATVSQCVIRGSVNLRNCEFYNNILAKQPGYGLNYNSSGNVHHNVFVAYDGFDWNTVVSDAVTNLLNYNGPLFVGGSSPDGQFDMVDDPLNLALTSGSFNDECGMFGGAYTYKLSGIPPIPTIYEFSVPSAGNTLPVRVKARASN